jgi:hypothetical protein
MSLRIITLTLLIFTIGAYQTHDEWQPLGGMVLGPILWSGYCGDDLMVGLDKNRNRLIDHCYCVKMVGKRMYYRQLKIYYEYDPDTMSLEKQGCVCK